MNLRLEKLKVQRSDASRVFRNFAEIQDKLTRAEFLDKQNALATYNQLCHRIDELEHA